VAECGERVVLIRDTISDDGGAFVMGDVLTVVGHRGNDLVLVDDTDHYLIVPPGMVHPIKMRVALSGATR
jgi:hypothetical protein